MSGGGGGGGMPRWQRKAAKKISADGAGVANGMQVAGFNPDQLAAQDGVRASQGYLDGDSADAQARAKQLAGGVSAGDISQFYNPYENDVVGSFMADLQHMRGMNDLAANDLAEKSNAFGGSRDAVYRAVSGGELDRNAMGSIAALRQGGYRDAMSAALDNQGLRISGNAQLQQIIDARRAGRYGDLGALSASGYAQQAQTQRQMDLPQNRLRFRMEANGQPLQGSGGPGGDRVGAGLAGYQDGYKAIGGLLAPFSGGGYRPVYEGGGVPGLPERPLPPLQI